MSREPFTHCGVRDSSLLADCQLGQLLLWGFVLVGFPQVKSKVQQQTTTAPWNLPQHWPSSLVQSAWQLYHVWSCGGVVFCFATVNGKITRLTTRLRPGVTCLTCSLLSTLIKGAMKGELDAFFFFWSNTLQVVSFLAFIATHPLLLVDTISVDDPIANVLHFKPHLVWCLNRTNETFPLKGFHTSGMFILIQVLCKLHSKEEKIKQVRVMVWVDARSRSQVGSFVFLLHLGH